MSPARYSYFTHDTVISNSRDLVYLFCILIRSGSRSNVAVAKQSKQRSGAMVFRWGHSRSRESRFHCENKNSRFSCQTCLKLTGFKKREARGCDSTRARKRECDNEGEISLPRPRTLAISSFAFFFSNQSISDTFEVQM